MFSVPGWSVPASQLKTQTADPKIAASDISHNKNKASSSLKKRKRARHASKTLEVNSDNLQDLWEEFYEKKKSITKQASTTTSQKNSKFLKDALRETESAPVISGIKDFDSKKPTSNEKKAKKKSSAKEYKTFSDTQIKESESAQTKPIEAPKKSKRKRENQSNSKHAERESRPKIASAVTDLDKSSKLAPDIESQPKSNSTLTPLQASMRQKLISSRFRYLNQTLYSEKSSRAMALFQENPDMFDEYHEGFRRQVEVWPENPVASYLLEIKTRGGIKGPKCHITDKGEKIWPLPRTGGICNIADLGCGDAALSIALQSHLRRLQIKIHSFDLCSKSKLVTVADIANLPLPDMSIDVAIFCLALMGTNWIDFIEEAFRVLRWKGELWIAEIKSRFGRTTNSGNKMVGHNVGSRKPSASELAKEKRQREENINDSIAAVEVDGNESKAKETDVSFFVQILNKRGFTLHSKESEAFNLNNKMFVKMYFTKSCAPCKGKFAPSPESTGNASDNSWKKKSKSKFIDSEDLQDSSREASALKPCVYKPR